jgi:alpha/beta hydrolase family protein
VTAEPAPRHAAAALARLCGLCLLLLLCVLCAAARADVVRVDVATRADVGTSGYEKIVGTIHFAVDPKHPRNRVVVDLDKAPVNDKGLVEFSSDLYILRPKATPGNGVALVDILNRGNKVVLNGFNRGGSPDPATENDLGDKFLMRFGYTIVWVGWEFDVAARPNAMRMYAPIATDGGKPISGVVSAHWTANTRDQQFVVTDLAIYDAIDPAGPDSSLLACPTNIAAVCEVVPRDAWTLKGHTVTLRTGFVAGTTYRLRYRAANPPVAGLGFVAIRDAASWLKHQPDAVAPVRYAYGYGSSQSGRFLRGFLYEGFNTDEKDRQVFDAVMAHIAGAARIDLNARWAKPTTLGVHDATSFPFADAALKDPVTGAVDGELDNPRMAGHAPKVFYTNTPVEYWGTGRVAAMVHTSPDGKTDLTPPDNVRFYFIAGTQHSPARFPPAINNGQQPDNSVDYWWTMRALLLAMNRWVKEGVAPPPSRQPRLADGTLVAAKQVAFPAIPDVASPRALSGGLRAPNRLLATRIEPPQMSPLPLLVPQVDEDGNERSGIRLPDVAVPLATYTGWNFRNPAIGAPAEIVSLLGASIPFAPTRAARAKSGDPRRAIEERYRSKQDYLARCEQAAEALVKERYLLIDDVPRILQRAEDTWDLLTAEPPAR